MQTPKATILGVDFDLISYDDACRRILNWREAGRREYITITNPHVVMVSRSDAKTREALARAALTLPDGISIIVAANLLRLPNHGRVTGPSLMLRLCDWGRAHGLRHYFYGGAEGVAERLAERLAERYPGLQVAGLHCPPFRALSEEEDAAAVEAINAARPDVVWVGLGAPKQEKWMLDHAGRLGAAATIGVGAAFDFHSGTVLWSPAWVRKYGLEWAFRLLLEPRRMWRRDLYGLEFLARVAAFWARGLLGGRSESSPRSRDC